MGGRKKKFIDKKNSATFQLIARDTSDPSFSQSDRVFVRVDNNPVSFPVAEDSGFDDAADDYDDYDGVSGGPLSEDVRKEILQLGFPDDGYNYLNHLREIKNTGAGAAFFHNPKFKLQHLPRDVKAYDASRLQISEAHGEPEENSLYSVASKTTSVRVQKAVDPEVAALLDDSDVSRLGSDDEDLEEDFVVQANILATEPIPTPFFSCRRHFPTLQLHIPAGPTSRRRRRNWVVYSSRQKPPTPIYSSVIERALRRGIWPTRFDILWKWLSRLVSFYLLSLNLAVAASDYPTPSSYPCEDISNYYTPVKNLGLTGEALKRQLNSIIAPHHSLSYREVTVWDALKVLDAADVNNPEASSEIVEIYSLRVVPKRLSGKPEGWNREHLWPRSYGLTKGPSLTDLHNIRPADVNVNASRGNKYYGECVTSSTKCLRPANKEAAFDTETDKQKWAPPMQVRGDIARALMYMAVCYGFQQPGQSPSLRLSDTPNIENREMGLLSILLKWNEVDPPSREEKLRNERICKFYQHNRNPFIDHPEYVNLIWK